MAKETKLNENAQIYQPRDNRSEKEKWLSMDAKQRWQYFNEYYRNKLIIGTVCAGFLIYLLYTIFGPKVDTVLYTAILDGCIDTVTAENFEDDMIKQLQLNPKKSNVVFDDSFYLSGANDYGTANQMKLATYVADKGIDIMILPEDLFLQYAGSGYFTNLSDSLPTQLFSNLTDNFYYCSTEDNTNEAAYGIYLEDYATSTDNGQIISRPVLGIVSNSEHVDNAVKFIQYLNLQ